MSETIHCAAGCKIRDQHWPSCEDQEKCRGCLPRTAEHGNLCAWCYRQLETRLSAVPDLVRHLRAVGEPHAQAAPMTSDVQHRGDPAEGNVLPAAWLAADELHANLASWALLILEEHPNGAQMVGPDEVGAWHTRYGTVVGIAHVNATKRLVAWLTPWLPWCAEQMWAPEMAQEVRALVDTTRARWPQAGDEPTRPIAHPCPSCDRMGLSFVPPRAEGDPYKVVCGNPDCAKVWNEAQEAWLANMAAKSGRMGA